MATPTEIGSTTFYNDANLVAYYKLENVNDSKNSFNLTNNNSVTFTAGKFNNAATFGNGSTNQSLTISNNLGYTGGDVTITGWFKCTQEPGVGELQYLYLLGDATNNVTMQVIYKNPSGTKQIIFERVREGTANDTATYNVTLGTTDFHHIAITYTANTVTAYVDGSSVTTVSSTGNGASGGTSQFLITANTVQAHGIIDDVAIFTRALTTTEINQLYVGFPVNYLKQHRRTRFPGSITGI